MGLTAGLTYAELWYSLKRLGFKSYADYLKSDTWKANKAALAKHPYYKQCAVCHSPRSISLHHLHYRNLSLLTHYPVFIVPLCRSCHYKTHTLAKHLNIPVEVSTRLYFEQHKAPLTPITAGQRMGLT